MLIDAIPATAGLAKTAYAEKLNSALIDTVMCAAEMQAHGLEGADMDQLGELARSADTALSDMQTRLQEYNIQVSQVRDVHDLFMETYRALYAEESAALMEKKVAEFEELLEREKLGSASQVEGTLGEKLLNSEFWRGVGTDAKKLYSAFKDSLKQIASFIPRVNVQSEYRTRLEAIFGEQAMKEMHEETDRRVLPRVEEAVKKYIDRDFEGYRGVFERLEVPGTGFAVEGLSMSTLVSSVTAFAGIAGTAVLAAGWHTIAWSVMNMFLPFLFEIIIPIAVLTSIGFHNRDINKKKDSLREKQAEVNTYMKKQVLPVIMDSISGSLKKAEKESMASIIAARFPGADGMSAKEINMSVMELSSLIKKITLPAGSAAGRDVIARMRKKYRALEGRGNGTTEALYLAGYLESMLGLINSEKGFNVSTFRDGGIAAVAARMRDSGMLDEAEFSSVTRGRRARNRIAHALHEFEAMTIQGRAQVLEALRQAVEILEAKAG